MIKVTKNLDKKPKHLANGGTNYNHKDVQDALISLYNDKCCYCEQKVEDFEVEHYRPRKPSLTDGHQGYPWLALEWSNLLWSCSTCNAGTGGKHSQFPIANPPNNRRTAAGAGQHDYLASSSYLSDEFPLLLHPEIDNPEEHLTILPNGKLEAINSSAKGEETIKVCNLNRARPINKKAILLTQRKKAIDELCSEIKNLTTFAYKYLAQTPTLNQREFLLDCLSIAFDKIENNRAAIFEFALLHRVFYEKFDVFVDANPNLKRLSLDNTNAIKQTFAEYKANNP